MIRKYFCIVLLCLPFLAQSQSNAIQKFYNKYHDQDDISKVELKGWVLKLASTFADEEDADRLLSRITRLRVLSMDNGNLVSKSEYNSLLKAVRNDRFEDLMHFKEDGDNIQIMIREDRSSVTDILVLISGIEKFTLLSLEGKLKFSDIRELKIEVEGAEHFERVPNKKRAQTPIP